MQTARHKVRERKGGREGGRETQEVDFTARLPQNEVPPWCLGSGFEVSACF